MSRHPLDGGLLPADPDEALLARILPYTYFIVGCPFCKAGRGVDCCTPNYSVALGIHAARRKAVAQFGDMERYQAFAQLRAEQVELRAKVEAQLAKPLTPEQLATRAAISAVFDEAREQSRIRESAMRARCFDPWIHPEECFCREGRPYVAPAPKPRVVRDVTDLAAVRARKAGAR